MRKLERQQERIHCLGECQLTWHGSHHRGGLLASAKKMMQDT